MTQSKRLVDSYLVSFRCGVFPLLHPNPIHIHTQLESTFIVLGPSCCTWTCFVSFRVVDRYLLLLVSSSLLPCLPFCRVLSVVFLSVFSYAASYKAKTRQRQDKGRTRQDKTRRDKTRQRQDKGKTRQDKTRRDKARQDKTRQDKAR
jgi:hypothetical protein